MDRAVKTAHRSKSAPVAGARRPDAPRRPGGAEAGKALAGSAASALPNEMLSSQAKDRISDLVKKAATGGRTTVISRGYAIAIVGPLADISKASQSDAVRLPTTEIKSGQTSIKGVIARNDCAVLTVHGEDRAAVYRPKVRRQPAQTEDKLDRLIELLDATGLIERDNARAGEANACLERLATALHAHIEQSLDLLEKIDPEGASLWRARHSELRKTYKPPQG